LLITLLLASPSVGTFPPAFCCRQYLSVSLSLYDHVMAGGDPVLQDALAYGKPVTDDMLECGSVALAWSVVEQAKRLAAA
jgi:hypothetical protein